LDLLEEEGLISAAEGGQSRRVLTPREDQEF